MTDSKNIPVIFLAFANEAVGTATYLRNLAVESRRLREVLEKAVKAGLCEVVERSNTTAGDIFAVFQDPHYRNRIGIFHYAGHANGYQLLLESAAGEVAAADAGGLAAFLAQQQGLKLVVLNGCSTQQQTQGLLEANVPAVISTARDINDQVATDFAAQFYQGLAGGSTIRTAYSEAQAAAQTATGGETRGLYKGGRKAKQEDLEEDRWPWELYLRKGSEQADQWNLPQAVGDPLFGLPELQERDLPESPYRHLNWFTQRDAEVFFGRGYQTRELYDRLTAPHTAPILLFYGQSGVGKSSVLDAGLIPRLERNYDVRYARRGADGLLATLHRALGGVTETADEAAPRQQQAEQLGTKVVALLDEVREGGASPEHEADLDLRDQLLLTLKTIFSEPGHYLRDTANRLFEKLGPGLAQPTAEPFDSTSWCKAEEQMGRPLIIFLDQVEELFTHPRAAAGDELEELLQALDGLFGDPGTRPQGRLVLGFRKEWLAELEAHLIAHELPRTKLFLEPLDRRGIIEVVQGPARSPRLRERFGLTVDDGLAEIIADDLLADRDSAIAPTLQILLTKMWVKAVEDSPDKPRFTQDMYQTLLDEGILLRDFLNQQISKFHENYPEAVDSGLLIDLLALHTTALGTAGQCELAMLQKQYPQLGVPVSELLQQCQDLHLLTVAASNGKATGKFTRLAHDTLAPLVRERFDESDLPGQRARRILDNRSVDWMKGEKGTPLDEADLAVVERGINGTRTLNDTEKLLVNASIEQRTRRELSRRREKIFKMVAVAVIIMAGAFGWWQWGEATQQTALTIQKEKMLLAELHRADPVFGRLIAREVPGPQKGWSAIAADLNRYRIPELLNNPEAVTREIAKEVAFGVGGSLAIGNDANEVWLWVPDPTGILTPILVGSHDTFLWDVEFSLDGNTIASSDNNGIVQIWGVDEPAATGPRHRLEHSVEGAALRVRLSKNGGVVAVLIENDTSRAVFLWHLDEDQPRPYRVTSSRDKKNWVTALAVSPDGSQLLLGHSSGAVWLWSTDSGSAAGPVKEFEALYAEVQHVAFSEDGTMMGGADNDGSIRWWSSDGDDTGEKYLGWTSLGFRLHGGQVFVAGQNSIYVGDLDAAADEPLLFVPEFFTTNIWDADFDGERFVTVLEGHDEVSIWDVNDRPEPRVLTPDGEVGANSWAVDAVYLDGDRLLAAYQDGTVRVWSSLGLRKQGIAETARRPIARVIQSPLNAAECAAAQGPACETLLTAVAASADGSRYATAFANGSIIVGSTDAKGDETQAKKFVPPENDSPLESGSQTCGFPFVDATQGAGGQNPAWSLAFDDKAERLIVGYQDGRVLLLDIGHGQWTTVGVHKRAVCAVDWARGDLLLSGSLDGKAQIWAIKDGVPAPTDKFREHNSGVYAASFDATGERVVTGADDNNLRIWDISENTLDKLDGYLDRVRAAVFSPAGDWVLSAGGNLMGINCLGPEVNGGHAPCEPGADMITVNTPNEDEKRLARAVAIAPTSPQFAVVDAAGGLSLYRNDYRVALWQQQDECLTEAKRMEILSESAEQARVGRDQCMDLVAICRESASACQSALSDYSLVQ